MVRILERLKQTLRQPDVRRLVGISRLLLDVLDAVGLQDLPQLPLEVSHRLLREWALLQATRRQHADSLLEGATGQILLHLLQARPDGVLDLPRELVVR